MRSTRKRADHTGNDYAVMLIIREVVCAGVFPLPTQRSVVGIWRLARHGMYGKTGPSEAMAQFNPRLWSLAPMGAVITGALLSFGVNGTGPRVP